MIKFVLITRSYSEAVLTPTTSPPGSPATGPTSSMQRRFALNVASADALPMTFVDYAELS